MSEIIETLPLIKPMLAHLGGPSDLKRTDYIWEPKLDGTRALVYKEGESIRILNRRQRWIEYRYPEFNRLSESITLDKCILDGEIVVFDASGKPNFRLLQEREHQEKPESIEILANIQPATFVVFDVPVVNQRPLFEIPLIERKKILSENVREGERIKICYFTSDGEQLWEASKRMGLEGIMGKQKFSAYQAGVRSRDWLKVKNFKTADLVIVGYTPGEGQRRDFFGALALGAYRGGKLVFMGKVGTGFDENFLKSITPELKRLEVKENPVGEMPPYEVRWVRPELVCEVKYMELTPDLKLRAPSFKGLRFDKAPEECELPEE